MSASESSRSASAAGFWSRFWRPALPGDRPRTGAPQEARSDAPLEDVSPGFDAAGPGPAPAAGAEAPGLPFAQPAEPPPGASAATLCNVCAAPRLGDAAFCADCGWMFPTAAAAPAPAFAPLAVGCRLAERYEILAHLPARPGVARYRVRDLAAPGEAAEAVLLVSRLAAPERAQDALDEPPASGGSTVVIREDAPPRSTPWPGMDWEANLLARANEHGLPRLIDAFQDNTQRCLVHELAAGTPLWDAWDDPAVPIDRKFAWLIDLARTLMAIHECRAIVEALRPDILRLGVDGKPRFVDLAEFLPLPLPDHVDLQASLYAAPELILQPLRANERSDLYGFGALFYALLLGRELAETDFEMHGVAKPFLERFPDAHPLLARLMLKTFVRDPSLRFPSEEAAAADRTGFLELIAVLENLGRQLGQVRLDVASWTSTGLERSGNEDACAVLHASCSRQEAVDDRALVLLTDGMGGCEAGEVASAMAIDHLRGELLKDEPFASLMHAAPQPGPALEPGAVLARMKAAVAAANLAIHDAAAAPGSPYRGMGCTAEVAFVEGHSLYVAHVGDSRTYLYSQGSLRLLTRDQTFIAHYLETGQLTEEEAQFHPRRHELRQALGGHATIEPELIHQPLLPGDVVLLCSDGLTGMVEEATIAQILQRGLSAEATARRLTNLANHRGGVDNTSVAVIRLS
jgi:serine/threonine protein phosphatase PrpC